MVSLPRPCDGCKKRFQPATPGTKICDDCHKLSQEKRASKSNSMKENKKYPYKTRRSK